MKYRIVPQAGKPGMVAVEARWKGRPWVLAFVASSLASALEKYPTAKIRDRQVAQLLSSN